MGRNVEAPVKRCVAECTSAVSTGLYTKRERSGVSFNGCVCHSCEFLQQVMTRLLWEVELKINRR